MNIENLKNEIEKDLEKISTEKELQELEKKYLGKTGPIMEINKTFSTLSNEEKKELGMKLNEIRTYLNEEIKIKKEYFEQEKINEIKAKEISKFPSIIKDLAFVVDKKMQSETIINKIKKAGGRLLTNISLFDIYEGENIDKDSKSMAYSLTFSDPAKTLSDEEVNLLFNKIIDEVTKKLNIKLRG